MINVLKALPKSKNKITVEISVERQVEFGSEKLLAGAVKSDMHI